MWVSWKNSLATAERWLLPASCLGCGSPVTSAGEPLVCDVCRIRWRPVPTPVCQRCGEPRRLAVICRICPEWDPSIGPVRSAVLLDDSARRLLHQFKYHGWRRLADGFAQPMAPLLRQLDCSGPLVPIPLAPGRTRSRGYNQAAELAAALGRITGIPVHLDLLARGRETGTQTRLGTADRLANLAGAFSARAAPEAVILVDDVFTTGATLVSAANALLDAGASRVAAVTFARAEAPLAGLARQLTRLDRGA